MPNEQNQKAIAAILKELELPLGFKDKGDRLAIQKAIYLSQVAGANLGYWFRWYLNGPYSSALADDYYEANNKLAELTMLSASQQLKEKLAAVKGMIQARPPEVSPPQWLEALASLDYMHRVQRKPLTDLERSCAMEKPHLSDALPKAIAALTASKFIN